MEEKNKKLKIDWVGIFKEWKSKDSSDLELLRMEENESITLKSGGREISILLPQDKESVFFVTSENSWQPDLNSYILSTRNITLPQCLTKVEQFPSFRRGQI